MPQCLAEPPTVRMVTAQRAWPNYDESMEKDAEGSTTTPVRDHLDSLIRRNRRPRTQFGVHQNVIIL